MWMLIRQYRFKIRTPLQEIIANARDAQRENGNANRPLKIQLPTKIEPTCIIRDFGTGITPEVARNIIPKIGATTKSHTNKLNGGFGVGLKGILGYSDSFNIKTFIDGQYWFYIINRTQDDSIEINLLATGETSEENGTEVQIPVDSNDTEDFKDATKRCTMFWEVQPSFNLKGEDIFEIGEGSIISDTLKVYKDNDLDNLFNSKILAVVDGIPYEIDNHSIRENEELKKIDNMLGYSSHAVIELNTGDIDLLQTRESIDDTERTKLQLARIASKGLLDLETYIASCLNDKSLEGRLTQYQDTNAKFRNIESHKFQSFLLWTNNFDVDKKIKHIRV